MFTMKITSLLVIALMWAAGASAQSAAKAAASSPAVVFVCEHGAANCSTSCSAEASESPVGILLETP